MQTIIDVIPQKKVRIIPPKPEFVAQIEAKKHKQLRTAAYCRVSTDKDEQQLSFDAQVEYYTEKIMKNPEWSLVNVFSDEGISGMTAKKRTGFLNMIKQCKQGKIDQIITKSFSRFARNTVDSLEYIRMLQSLGVSVIFEKEGLDTSKVTNEFLITIYSSLAQAESESHSGNVKWGKQKSFKRGNTVISYANFLGYRKGVDGKPEIHPEEAEIIKRIYNNFLAGDSLKKIADELVEDKLCSPTGKEKWSSSTINSILSNEKYKGDSILQKTFINDCMSKKVQINIGQLPKYYVENSHPAIIDKDTWNRVQEELARRGSKRKVKEVGTKTEQGKYSSKYALTELLICGDCGTPYRRVTWARGNKKKIVWRCINRLDYGKKYCKNSPSVEEIDIQSAIVSAIKEQIHDPDKTIEILKLHIGMGINEKETENNENDIYTLQLKIKEIDNFINDLIIFESQNGDKGIHDAKFEELYIEKNLLKKMLKKQINDEAKNTNYTARLNEIFAIIDKLKDKPIAYDNQIIRQLIECVKVISKEKLKIIFRYGVEVDIELTKIVEKFST